MESQQHILLAKARLYPRKSADLRPANCDYDKLAGAWIDRRTGMFLIELEDMEAPQTKKHDVETGEDQKGH